MFGEVSAHWFGDPRFLYELDKPDLGGVVAVLGGGLVLRDHAGTRLKDSGWADVTLAIEELRHADLLS